MSTTSVDVKKKFVLRASTADSGFSVKQSEETIRNLQKENFNLKLKMFVLSNRKGSAPQPVMMETCHDDFIDLLEENEAMKSDLSEKQSLLEAALNAIRSLEYQKDKFEQKCEDLISEKQMPEFKASNPVSKKVEQLKVKLKQSSTGEAKKHFLQEASNEVCSSDD